MKVKSKAMCGKTECNAKEKVEKNEKNNNNSIQRQQENKKEN